MVEQGVGALTVSEVARRMGMRAPSLYKYFDSLHALYDQLFWLGLAENEAAVRAALEGALPGVQAIRRGLRASVRWCIENPELAQLLYWRVVPGFEPSAETFLASRAHASELRELLSDAVRRKQLVAAADSDEAAGLLTVLISGLVTQQLANEPGVTFDRGRFTSLTDQTLDLFFDRYRTGRRSPR